jgi:hypothetical protein
VPGDVAGARSPALEVYILTPLAALASLTAALSFPAAAQQDKPPQHVRGDVVAVNGDTLDVRTRGGQIVRLAVSPQAGVAKVEEADPSAIDDGGFIGVTAVPQPGTSTLRAVEVHVFPESMRGTGEGHRPWDLGTGSSMTNGTVSGTHAARQGTGSSMTNGTVAKVALSSGLSSLRLTEARCAGAFLGLMLVVAATNRRALRIPRRELLRLALFGAVGVALVQLFYFLAIHRLAIAIALLIQYLGPVLDDEVLNIGDIGHFDAVGGIVIDSDRNGGFRGGKFRKFVRFNARRRPRSGHGRRLKELRRRDGGFLL